MEVAQQHIIRWVSANPQEHSTNIIGLYAAGEVAGGLHGQIDLEAILFQRFLFLENLQA